MSVEAPAPPPADLIKRTPPDVSMHAPDETLPDHLESGFIRSREWGGEASNDNPDKPDFFDVEYEATMSPTGRENTYVMRSDKGTGVVEHGTLTWYPGGEHEPSRTIDLKTLFDNGDAPSTFAIGEQWGGFEEFGKVNEVTELEPGGFFAELPEDDTAVTLEGEAVVAPDSQEAGEQEESHEGMTRNDELLARYLLGIDGDEYDSTYGLLTGMKSPEARKPWEADKQPEAEAGMRELIETALGVHVREEGIDGARLALARLRTEDDMQPTREKLASYGRRLKYQNMSEESFPDGFKQEGDFLHFGIKATYEGAPDKLEYPTRIYVTPKMEATGHVAAEVIKRARAQGYEPHGKVWDDVSREGDVNDRLDRILFWPKTESQTKIIMEALADIQAEQPELFEDEGPLGTSETVLRGVGLAEDPVQTKEVNQSFNQVREELIRDTWQVVQGRLLGQQTVGRIGYKGANAELRQAVQRGDINLEEVVDILGQEMKQIAPNYHVSPDNFALNMR